MDDGRGEPLVGSEPRGASRLIQRRKLVSPRRSAAAAHGVHGIDPRALAGSLPLAQRQIVEITGALMREPRILFLDEPTSALAEHEVAWLFGLVRKLRDAGGAILFTSHRWNEVASLADRITILRNGAHVATRERFDEDEAVTLMTGRTIDRMYPDNAASRVGEPSRPRGGRPSRRRPQRRLLPAAPRRDPRRRRPGRPGAAGALHVALRGPTHDRAGDRRRRPTRPSPPAPPTRSGRASRSRSYPRTARRRV